MNEGRLEAIAEALANQSQTGGQQQTGNPQQLPQSNLQQSLSQSSNLQNAGSLTPTQVRALDQGTSALQVSGVDTSVPLNFSNNTTATVQQPGLVPPRNEAMAYIAIALVIAICMAVIAYGLFKPRYGAKR